MPSATDHLFNVNRSTHAFDTVDGSQRGCLNIFVRNIVRYFKCRSCVTYWLVNNVIYLFVLFTLSYKFCHACMDDVTSMWYLLPWLPVTLYFFIMFNVTNSDSIYPHVHVQQSASVISSKKHDNDESNILNVFYKGKDWINVSRNEKIQDVLCAIISEPVLLCDLYSFNNFKTCAMLYSHLLTNECQILRGKHNVYMFTLRKICTCLTKHHTYS